MAECKNITVKIDTGHMATRGQFIHLPLRNIDRVQRMNVNELARFLDEVQKDAYSRGMLEAPICNYPNRLEAWAEWLRSNEK